MKFIRKILLVVGIILSCVFITSCSFSTNDDKDETFPSDEEIIAQLNDYTHEKVGKGYVITVVKDKTITNVIIPYGVISIGSSAFYECSSLKSITIPNSVTSIGSSAFSGCTDLVSVILSSEIITINDFTFSDCISLLEIEIPSKIENIYSFAFYNCYALTTVMISRDTSIALIAFEVCKNINYVYR